MLLSSLCLFHNFASAANDTAGTVTMFSDAQCPCSAQFVADIEHLLKSESLKNGKVDFHQYFVPACMDAVDHCDAAKDPQYYTKCIHGDEECLGHRYFLCAQNLTGTPGTVPSYRDSQQWLNFQNCSYGQCSQCDVFTELLCLTPCTTYATFTQPSSNDIMKTCAGKTGINWEQLQQCANGPAALELQKRSAEASRAAHAAYGTKGLPVVYITSPNGTQVQVKTAQPGAPLPLYCGPTPLEVLRVICGNLLAADPTGNYPDCASESTMCNAIAANWRLPECKVHLSR